MTPSESQKDWEEFVKIHKNWEDFEFGSEILTLSGKLSKNWDDNETKEEIENIFHFCRRNENFGYVDIQCNRCEKEIHRDITGMYCDCKTPSVIIEKILSDYTFPEDQRYFGIRKISDIPTIMYKNDSQLFVQGLDYKKYSVIIFDEEDPEWKTVHRDWISIDKLLNELDSSHVIADSAYEALTSIDRAIFLCLDLLILKKWNHKGLQKTIEKIIDWKFMLMILWTTSNKYLSYEDEDNPIMINIDAYVIPKIKQHS